LGRPAKNPEHLRQLESWLRSYRPEELFDTARPSEAGAVGAGAERRAPHGRESQCKRGMLLRDLRMPDFTDYGVDVPKRGVAGIGDRTCWDVSARCSEVERGTAQFPQPSARTKRCRWSEAVFEATNRQWLAATADNDEFLAPQRPVMEMLSEHHARVGLEGYL